MNLGTSEIHHRPDITSQCRVIVNKARKQNENSCHVKTITADFRNKVL